MIKKSSFPFLFLFFFLFMTYAHAGSARYTFVHPAPSGNYQDIDVRDTLTVQTLKVNNLTEIQGPFLMHPINNMSMPPCALMNQGTMAFNGGMLQICRSTDGGTSAGWEPAGAFAQSADTGNTYLPHGGNLVITGSTAALPAIASGAGVRSVWAANKKAYRAGEVDGAQWDEANIGEYSVAFGYSTLASGQYSSAFGSTNYATGTYSSVTGGFNNAANQDGAFIGGGTQNISNDIYSTVVGGYTNKAMGPGSFVGSGGNNEARSVVATVGGGFSNLAEGDYSSILGGAQNKTYQNYGFIGGGLNNSVNAGYGTITGGRNNSVAGLAGVVSGGEYNYANGDNSWVGGRYMTASNTANGSFVWGQSNSTVTIDAPNVAVFYGVNAGFNETNPQRAVHIRDVMRLEPRDSPPNNAVMGDIYVDSSGALCFYDGAGWFAAAGAGACDVDFGPAPETPSPTPEP